MKFYGMVFSMIDYPGKLGLTVFTKGCNLRCPICHNPSLVDHPLGVDNRAFGVEEVIDAIREKWIDGVCVTGGEPTLHESLPETLAHIKEKTEVAIKLDTNGTRPTMMATLLDEELVDFVAMDVKAPLIKGPLDKVIGFEWDNGRLSPPLRQTLLSAIHLVKEKAPNYHFRTVCFEKFLSPEDIGEIAKTIAPCKGYVLLPFDPHDTLDVSLRGEETASYAYMNKCLEEAQKHVPDAQIEGR